MRVCIVTRMDYGNYGNRLQNYALKKLLEEVGIESLSGLQVIKKRDWEETSKGIRRLVKKLIPIWLYKNYYRMYCEGNNRSAGRRQKFIDFTTQYIGALPCFIVKDDKDLCDSLEEYNFDYYIAGSDQIWNPKFSGRDFEFLAFAPYEKRLSFAASFGVDKIPEGQKDRYRKLLSGMRYISIRETQGVKIAEQLTGRNDIDLTLDPTLLLEKEKWESLIKRDRTSKPDHYIATYFLGELPESVLQFSERLGLPVLRLNDKEQKEIYELDPIGFLSVIHDADFVLTDSFHATAFSIIYRKEFYVFRRKEKGQVNMFNRLENLLTLLNLTDRISSDIICEKAIDRITEERWNAIEDYLLSQKNKAMNKTKTIMCIGD